MPASCSLWRTLLNAGTLAVSVMTMADLFPPIEPYACGMLDVADGNATYWEACGNPDGKPALLVHGGPGIGCSARMRQAFDPAVYRIVLFDQRGCGRSTPHASDASVDMHHNTTHHLVSDMEKLREHLGIERWLLSGGSWGTTLALAYAQRFPHRVSELVLLNLTLSRRSDIDWLYRGVARFFPSEWEQFRNGVPLEQQDDLVSAYARLMSNLIAATRQRFAGHAGRMPLSRSIPTLGPVYTVTVPTRT